MVKRVGVGTRQDWLLALPNHFVTLKNVGTLSELQFLYMPKWGNDYFIGLLNDKLSEVPSKVATT